MSGMLKSFTAEYNGYVLELATKAGINEAILKNDVNPQPKITNLLAIWDTGATGCAITKQVAESLNIKPIGEAKVAGVHGIQIVNNYLISLFLPNNFYIPELEATEIDVDAGCDILIGMNVINLGDFSISTLGGKTTFSFRTPAYQINDFVKYSPSDNSICTCGSGNMFKDCCQKLCLVTIG